MFPHPESGWEGWNGFVSGCANFGFGQPEPEGVHAASFPTPIDSTAPLGGYVPALRPATPRSADVFLATVRAIDPDLGDRLQLHVRAPPGIVVGAGEGVFAMARSAETKLVYEVVLNVSLHAWNGTRALVGHVELEVSDQHGARSGPRRVAVLVGREDCRERANWTLGLLQRP